ncbi:branched-chain amino acid ABC transporter permease [Streptomonospora nanhaiensis]|uniref:Branched-chain amino acid transport system permease protein n=1 Tax=Streptomonospora nanhaiensis TaxID=1323731 RepID=A0A853BHB1_9ACTN|nr:branched-chain amino acid ABC transporter permease [Streptomonospora nanhaiensis]MBV2366820.1 branched-chain amino acid ABC transporter permease [Streptomonospora nanhaiensis]MBX9390930.1 branched-chain amino acid ABC transporter permease [Streptomonospora nanhaiensis]NYI94769.1 branched-chain amino acid transport system permease protein [Streptomonospora nanhaiensis]
MDIMMTLALSLETAIGPIAAIYVLAAIGLNMHFGYTGLLNFGQVGFMLVGAYGVAVCVTTFGLPLWAGFGVSVLCSVVLALILGIPTLRLRADYLAISTIAVAEVLRLLYRAEFARPITGGVYGRQSFADGFYEFNDRLGIIPPGSYGIGDVDFSADELWLMLVSWGCVALALGMTAMLMRSPWGRVIKGIREDEDAVRSLGKDAFTYKLQSLVLGGVFGGVAGVLIALNQGNITPDQFMPQVTFYLWAMLLLGGVGTLWGPVIGPVIMWFLLTLFDESLRSLASSGALPFLATSDSGALRHALVGIALMLLIIYRPQGLVGNRKEMLVNVK